MQEITIDMLDELAKLFVKAFNEEPWSENWTVEQAKERIWDNIHTPKFYGAVEKDDDKIVGMIMGRGERYFDGVHFQILEFCVDNEVQGKGIGKRLLADFLLFLKNQGIEQCFLITTHGVRTEEFYKRNGFTTSDIMCFMHN